MCFLHCSFVYLCRFDLLPCNIRLLVNMYVWVVELFTLADVELSFTHTHTHTHKFLSTWKSMSFSRWRSLYDAHKKQQQGKLKTKKKILRYRNRKVYISLSISLAVAWLSRIAPAQRSEMEVSSGAWVSHAAQCWWLKVKLICTNAFTINIFIFFCCT